MSAGGGAARRSLPAVHRLAPRLFYGWIVAGGTSLLSFVTVGMGFYCLVVLLDALCREHGWSKTAVSGATSLYFVTVGLTATLIGRSLDRHGTRRWIVAGVSLMAVSLWGVGRIGAPWQLYAVYPFLAMGFAMAGAVPSSAIITRWFVARRARAMSIAQTGVSVGGVVLVPLATHLILSRGLATATGMLALLLLAVALPVTLAVLRGDPADYGLEPDGGGDAAAAHPLLGADTQLRRWSRREALRSRSFWLVAAAFSGMLFCQVAFAMHQLAFLRERMSAESAAFAVSATAFGSIVARLAVGSFADRVSKRRLGMVLFLLQAATLLAFSALASPAGLFAAAIVFGFTIGNIFMLQSLMVGELFGMTSYATVYGLLQLITQLSAGLGPVALGLLFEMLGGYERPLELLAGLAVASAVVVSRVRPPA